MPKHYEDEKFEDGTVLRHYLKSDEYAFTSSLYARRFATRKAAINQRTLDIEYRKRRDIIDQYQPPWLQGLDDLRKCPVCFGLVSVDDVLEHDHYRKTNY